LAEGRSTIGPLTLFPTEALQIRIGAEVAGFEPQAHFSDRQVALLDRFSQFAVVAAREAALQSGLDFAGALGPRTAAIIGSGVGGIGTLDDGFNRLYAQGSKRLPPLTVPRMMLNAAASHVSMALGVRGPTFAIASACASANHAIGTAFQMVRSGAVDAAVTGGAEASLTFGTIKAWEAIRVMAPDTCQPFSRDRKGMVLGEGAGMLVLENYDQARARGADILGEMLGFGMSADAGDIVLPSADGAAAALLACLADAGLDPGEVAYVNAHGTATTANDITETSALHKVFGDHARKLAVSSTKSLHGHAMGASGALEMVATLLAMRDGFIPPTANFTEPDPQCDLDYVPNETRAQKIGVALSNSFAFGGLNAVLAVRAA
ncbi:MAG TPA: beta-ketoacyl-[acyl-carrier-protein] synthase family protein, partial [Rhizomicrobium sp.]|nr:beta-ketoacyl-[acyl-carrier-protein] synthase family protein [Rhizomicrobium sp.]